MRTCCILLSVLLLTACNSDSGTIDTDDPSATVSHSFGDPQPEPVPASEAKSGLTDRTWILVELDGKPPAFPGATLRFEGKRLFANAGCNGIQGTFTRSGNRLTVREISMTEMGCDPFTIHAFEDAYATALSQTKTAKVNGNELALTGGPGLRFEAK